MAKSISAIAYRRRFCIHNLWLSCHNRVAFRLRQSIFTFPPVMLKTGKSIAGDITPAPNLSILLNPKSTSRTMIERSGRKNIKKRTLRMMTERSGRKRKSTTIENKADSKLASLSLRDPRAPLITDKPPTARNYKTDFGRHRRCRRALPAASIYGRAIRLRDRRPARASIGVSTRPPSPLLQCAARA